jgi:hypothetical protein
MRLGTVLWIQHPQNVSEEGAVAQRNRVAAFAEAEGLIVVGADTGEIDVVRDSIFHMTGREPDPS